MMPTATILAGETLSDAVDCTGGDPVFLAMPDQWTPAPISFQISNDGTHFYDLVDNNGNELLFNHTPGGGQPFVSRYAKHIASIKIRSGSKGHPVPQAADAVFKVEIQSTGV
jgi:hypothetical protein